MNIESMQTRSYRSFKADDAADLPAEVRKRLSAIRRYHELRGAGCAAPAALRKIGVGRQRPAPKSTRSRRVRADRTSRATRRPP